jgi:tellurite methyltransferase
MARNRSIDFFDSQFQRQVRAAEFALNPFELATLPHLNGRVLDFGCGLGNLAIAAARQGCSVVALDASPTAVARLRRVAAETGLPITAEEADLRDYPLAEGYDAVVSIGLLMFFDCGTAFRRLDDLQARVRPGGVAAVNVLVEGTTFMDMFERSAYCLFPRGEVQSRFAGWQVLHAEHQTFDAPNGTVKAFDTVVARRPG